MKTILASLLSFLICSSGIVDAMTDPQKELFLNRRSEKEKLYNAVDALGAISEQPDFWIRILGDSHYSLFHRRICEAMLFRRHVSIGMTVGQMKEALHTAQWLSPRDIATPSQSVDVPLPVETDSDNSVFIILFMGTERDEDTGVFIKVSGFLDLPS